MINDLDPALFAFLVEKLAKDAELRGVDEHQLENTIVRRGVRFGHSSCTHSFPLLFSLVGTLYFNSTSSDPLLQALEAFRWNVNP